MGFLLAIGFVLYVLCITQPFSLEEQVIFLLILGVIALTLFQAQTRFTLLMLIVISVIVSSRYVWWRYSETLNPNSYTSVIFTWLLIIAETYAFIVMLLGYFQVCWVLDRKPASLPKDKERWPSVDIFIPTYNEPLDVVKPTVYAALTVDWPKENSMFISWTTAAVRNLKTLPVKSAPAISSAKNTSTPRPATLTTRWASLRATSLPSLTAITCR